MDRIEERLAKFEARQEATIRAVNTLSDSMETQNALLRELLEWANQPPSTDLTEAFQAFAAAFRDLSGNLAEMPGLIAEAVAGRLR